MKPESRLAFTFLNKLQKKIAVVCIRLQKNVQQTGKTTAAAHTHNRIQTGRSYVCSNPKQAESLLFYWLGSAKM